MFKVQDYIQFVMKYYIWHVFGTFTPLKERNPDHSEDLNKMKLFTNVYVYLNTSLKGAMN